MPTVKTMTFKQGGHHATCADRRKYLENEDRHLERICVNVVDEKHWDAEMDRTRALYKLRGCVNYREFIISPDAMDHATQDQVRDLALRWLTENFPNAEAAIVLHDDNKERKASGKDGIVHAHVVVNSVDLETGRKMVIKGEKVREIHNSLQRIGKDLGLSVQPDYEPGKRLISKQEKQITQAERGMTLRGVRCWKTVVHDMALQALELSTTPAEFTACLNKADVDVTMENDMVYLTDRDNPTRSVRADKLDSRLNVESIAQRFGNNVLELHNYEDLHQLAGILSGELVQGNEMRAEMQAYDKRCRVALDNYKKLARKCDGMNRKVFPRFEMPEAETLVERMRCQQIYGKFHASAKATMDRHAIPTLAQMAAAEEDRASSYSWGGNSHHQQQRSYEPSHSRGLSR